MGERWWTAMSAEQLGFEQMPRRLLRATPTRLATWLDCPRRYRFTYLDRPPPQKGPPWAHNSVGASVHTALASWWRLPIERRTPHAAGDLVTQGWLTDGFRDDEQCRRWRTHARDWVEAYVDRLDPYDEPIGVERTVSLVTERLALSGRVDRIDERPSAIATRLDDEDDGDDEHDATDVDGGDGGDGGNVDPGVERRRGSAGDDQVVPGTGESGRQELVVVDYKTGRRVPNGDDARTSFQLAIYAAAAWRTLRRRTGRVELHHLPTGRVVSWYHQPDKLKRQLRRADDIGAEAQEAEERYSGGLDATARDEAFPPRVGPQCRCCDFAPSCPEGRTTYPPRAPWDALDPEV